MAAATQEFVPPEAKADQEFVPPEVQPAKPQLPKPAKKPITIDPGVDVGFGPGVAPPEISPETGMPISAAPSQPAPVQPPGQPPQEFVPPEAQPPAEKPYIMTGVGALPKEPSKVYKPPVAAAPMPAPSAKPVSIPADVDVGFGPGVAPPEISPQQETGRLAPGYTEAGPVEAAAEKKASEEAAKLPNAVTSLASPDDPAAQGKDTQAGDQKAKFLYDDETRSKALAYQTQNKQDLVDRAAKAYAADPNNTELLDRFADAAVDYTKSNDPGALEYGLRFTGGAIQTLLHTPQMIETLAKFGFTGTQAVGVMAKIATGQEPTMQDEAVLHTIMAAAEEGGGSTVELAENIRNWFIKHKAPSFFGPAYEATDPNMMTWDEINKLPREEQRAAFIAKAKWAGQRYQNAEARGRGELDPFWTSYYQHLTGHDPNTVAAMAEHGIKVDPGQVSAGSLVLNPLNLIFPAGDAILGEGLMTKLVAGTTEATADAIKGTGWLQQRLVEPWAPAAGRIGVRTGVTAGVRAFGLTHLPFPFNLVAASSLTGVKKFAGELGERLGQAPQWMRENWWEPYGDLLREHAEDISQGTNNVLANHGPLAPLLTQVPGGALKGAAIAAPFAIGAQTPEEAGSAVAFGGLLGAAHEAPMATRDAAFSTAFFRDPARYQTINAPKIDYGTDYGGMVLDQAHNNFAAGQSALDQQRDNDLRALLPNIEQYKVDDPHYQAAVAHLQSTINPATGQTYLPAGNLKTRGFNVVTDPASGKRMILINGDKSGFDVAGHEIGHAIYPMLSDPEKLTFKNLGAQFNNFDALTQRYTRNVSGTGYNYADLPTEAQIKAGTKKYLPGLDGLTQEHMNEEMGAETVAALLRGQPLHSFTRDPTLFRRAQMGLGSVLNKMGINVTPEEARTILGVKPSIAQMWMMDKALRDYFKRNPANVPGPAIRGGGGPGLTGGPKGQKAATGGPTGGPAQRPTPPPTGGPGPQPTAVSQTNNQPIIGGGATGAPAAEIEKAVQGLQSLGFKKGQAQTLIGSVTGQTADELIHHALQAQGKAAPGFEAKSFRTPQEAQADQAPVLPQPLAQHRLMRTGELVRRATFGDQQAVQTLIERHGANWLEPAEKEDANAAAMYRRKYPEEAAAQDRRLKVQAQLAEQAKVEGKPEPKPVVSNRISELRTQAENEVGSKVKNREAAVNRRHLQLVMEEHNASLPSGDTRVRAQVDPQTGRTVYYGTHFDPTDPVHQWLLSQMDPEERKFMAAAQAAIGNHVSMNFNYTHAPRTAEGEELPTGPEREAEYEEATAKERAAGTAPGQVGNRTALPVSVGVGADSQGLIYSMATDKIIGNAIKSINAMRIARMEPPYTADRAGMLALQEDMRKVSQNHAAGYSGDGSKALVGTRDRPVVRDANYVTQPVSEERAQFVNMVMNARDPLEGPRVTKAGRTTAAGKAVEFAEANQGYTSPIVSHGAERVEVNPMRKELERRGAFKGRELEHGYEQFRADLMRERDEPAPALRKHGIEAKEFTHAPERRFSAAGFMPEIQEGEITPEEFIKQRNRSAHPGFLSPLEPGDLAEHRLFTSPDGKIGAALSSEDDIQNVYNNSEPKIRGAGTGMLVHAIEQGGRTLDAYDGHLPRIYRQAGFIETGRMKFSDEHANPGWDYAKDDRPDVVFMGWGGYPEGGSESVLARAASTDKSGNIANEQSTRYYEPTDWDRAKEDSRAFSRGAELPRVDGTGRGPEAYPTRGGAPPERGEGVRGDTLGPEEGPQTPGAKVGYMPEMPEAQVGKKKKAVPIVRAPQELRELSPEQRAMLTDLQQKAAAGLDQFPDSPLSGASFANGEVDFPRADPKERLTKQQVGEFFDNRNERLDFANPEHQRIIAAALTHDILRRLISDPESLGWYNRVIEAAMQEIGKFNPKILEDPVHNLIMRISMAITSQNQKVHPNFESAYRAYLHWDRTGDLPIDAKFFGGGTKADAMIANFKKVNDLIADHGHAGVEEILKTPMSVRDIAELYDVKVPGEAQGYVSEASIMLGPKIGSFFNNLSKLYHTLTADLWFSRTMNRMAGRMLGFKKKALVGLEEPEVEGFEGDEEPLDEAGQDRGQHQLGKLRDLINKGQLENSTAKQRKTMLKEIRSLEAFQSDPEALDRDAAMALSPTIRDWAHKQHQIYAKSTGFNRDGKPLGTYGQKTKSNLLSKNIDLNFRNLQDTPRNGTERENFRDIMKEVQRNLASLGINIDHADNQAVLWYLEQDLFARAKGRKGGSFSADYLDAAYALRQKYEGKTPDKFGKVTEPEPPPAPVKARKAKAGAMPEGPPAPRPRERTPSWLYPPVSPAGYPQQQELARQQELPAALTELQSGPEPEVRRGRILGPPGQPLPAGQPEQASVPGAEIVPGGTGITAGYDLQPEMASKVEAWAQAVKRATGLDVVITEGRRSLERSNALRASGVLASPGGTSYHNYGEAIDFGFRSGNGVDLHNEAGYAEAEKIAHQFGLTGISTESGHIQNAQYSSWRDIPKEYLASGTRGGPDQETRRRTGNASAARIMQEEGPSDVQDGIPEIFGFRQGEDSEYNALARARAAGDEDTVRRIAAKGFVDRAIAAGSQQFRDPAIKAQIMSLAHMRGPGGARDILNAVATGKIDNSGSVDQLDPQAVQTINSMDRAEVMRRIAIARTVYDKAVHGQEYWNRFGRGLAARYAREKEFYGSMV